MNKPSKFMVVIAGIVCLVSIISFSVLYLSSSNARDNRNPAQREEMMITVLEWGRLAPFPANATNVSIETEGNSFTRSFRASFVASEQDLQTWIKDSPGINETTPEELSGNKVKYIIMPGGGANTVEVTIDLNLNKVNIYVSWS